MAITTIDGLLAGAQFPVHWHKHLGTETGEGQGILISPLYFIGTPGAAVVPSPGMAGAALTSYAGTLPFENPSSGNAYLMRQTASMSTTNTSMHFLCDRLWHNSGIDVTATGAQTINSVAWPARDRNGSTDGAEVMVGIEVSTETANGGAVTNTTLDYTNSDGTSGRTIMIVITEDMFVTNVDMQNVSIIVNGGMKGGMNVITKDIIDTNNHVTT